MVSALTCGAARDGAGVHGVRAQEQRVLEESAIAAVGDCIDGHGVGEPGCTGRKSRRQQLWEGLALEL